MKKILTVLLALSVVFTYTVGTAFAVSTEDLSSATNYADNMITSVASATKAEALAEGTYSATAIEQATEDATKIGSQLTNDLITLNTTDGSFDMDAFRKDINEWCGVDGADGTHVGAETSIDYAGDNYAAYFASIITKYDKAAKLDEAIAKVNAVKATDYTDQKIIDIDGTDYTHQQAAEIYCEKALEALDAVPDDDYATEINKILYGEGGSEEDLKDGGLFFLLDELTTVAEYEEENANAIIDVEHAVSEITYFAKRTYYDAKKVAAGDDVTSRLDSDKTLYDIKPADAEKITAAEAASMNANLTQDINDALEVLTVYFNELDDKTIGNLTAEVSNLENNATEYSAFTDAISDALSAKAFYEKVVALGDELKDTVSFTGDKMYDDVEIDEALAEAKTVIYGDYTKDYSAEAASDYLDVTAINDPVRVAINEAKDKWQDKIVYAGSDKTAEADKKYCKDYYATDWQDDYDEIKAEVVGEAGKRGLLDEAKTIDEVNAIMADADAKLAELRTAANDTAALAAAIAKNKAALLEYASEQLELLNGDGIYREDSFTNNTADAVKSAYEAGCEILDSVLSEAEVASAYEKAKALFRDIKTDAALDAEAAAVQTAIAALPATVTLENEDAFTTVYDAYQAYLANYGAEEADVKGYAVFVSKMGDLKRLQIAAVDKAIEALDDDNVITRDELTAVEEMYDGYVAYYDQYGENFYITKGTELGTAQEKVRSDEINAVKKLISKLTTNSSIEDILAAKEAYDKLTGSQQREIAESYSFKLDLMRIMLIDSVESLKVVKNHSTAGKTNGKSWIKIMWSTQGDDSAVQGYEIYKSTKKNSGYKYAFTTKNPENKWYKNTAGLKKGTRYYYKVRAFIEVDGEKYYSDWSNKAYRKAK